MALWHSWLRISQINWLWFLMTEVTRLSDASPCQVIVFYHKSSNKLPTLPEESWTVKFCICTYMFRRVTSFVKWWNCFYFCWPVRYGLYEVTHRQVSDIISWGFPIHVVRSVMFVYPIRKCGKCNFSISKHYIVFWMPNCIGLLQRCAKIAYTFTGYTTRTDYSRKRIFFDLFEVSWWRK